MHIGKEHNQIICSDMTGDVWKEELITDSNGNKAKAISAKLLELNLKNKLE
jgi:hypothetical protein